MQPLAIATGDPAGVGPMVSIDAAVQWLTEPQARGLLLYGDADYLEQMWRRRAPAALHDAWLSSPPDPSSTRAYVSPVAVAQWSREHIDAHAVSPQLGEAQLQALDAARQAVVSGTAAALVTAPVSKLAIHQAGHRFWGHTEYLATQAGLAEDSVTMMFLGKRLNVALVTTHHRLGDVPSLLSAARIERTLRHSAEALQRLYGTDASLEIAVTGLNPHAGEGGLLGEEEKSLIIPTLSALQRTSDWPAQIAIAGPMAAEAALRHAAEGRYQGVVAMFHDQATIACKLVDWSSSVNVTWGLPYVRTSVDHGVAYDAAALGQADAGGMLQAIRMASLLTSQLA